MPEPARPDEAALLTEIARLYAALIRVVSAIDDPQLKAEIADLIWPRPDAPAPNPPTPGGTSMSEVISPVRKLWVAIFGVVGVFIAQVYPPDSDVSKALIVAIPAALAAIGVYFASNADVNAKKAIVAFCGSLATLIVALIANGLDDWRSAVGPFGVSVLAWLGVYLTGNDPDPAVDAA